MEIKRKRSRNKSNDSTYATDYNYSQQPYLKSLSVGCYYHTSPSANISNERHESIYETATFSKIVKLENLEKCLPHYCFQKSSDEAWASLTKDFIMFFSLPVLLYVIESKVESETQVLIANIMYVFLQGFVMLAFFILGHDCGHGLLFGTQFMNDSIGNILHSIVLLPYHQWRESHNYHHLNVGNLEQDDQYPLCYDVQKTFFLKKWFFHLMIGYYPKKTIHFWTENPIYGKNFHKFTTSILNCFVMVTIIGASTYHFGLMLVAKYYLNPLSIFLILRIYTLFMQHQNEMTTWFSDECWSYDLAAQGVCNQNCFGIFSFFTHCFEFHQIHHMFPNIPHYRLKIAKNLFLEDFPTIVRVSRRSFLTEFICSFVNYVFKWNPATID